MLKTFGPIFVFGKLVNESVSAADYLAKFWPLELSLEDNVQQVFSEVATEFGV